MFTALMYGFLASAGLLVGAVVGILTTPPRRLVAGIVAFGSGILVSTLTFDLMEEAFETGNTVYVVSGFLSGAVLYVGINAILDRMAAQSPKREGRDAKDVVPGAAAVPETPGEQAISSTALLVGALIDGIPEQAALGISLRAGGGALGLVLLAAIFLGNLPESMSSAVSMRKEGRSRGFILMLWGGTALVCTAATVIGYAALSGLAPNWISALLAFAAGGILAMLADTMMPEAFREGGPFVALATCVGFIAALLLSQFTR